MLPQISESAAAELTKQKYRIVGSHSAVKTCGWTKKMVKGEGGCYKLKFYGIMSHQCMQMTPSMSCANRCSFCWRGYKAPVSKEWTWNVDDPEDIITGAEQAHHDLLVGLKGYEGTNAATFKQSQTVKHVALSLTGEPITYPRMQELLNGFNKRGISTFLVTNATYPEAIRDLPPITQLYISLDAPTKELLKEVDQPLFPDFWERLNRSLAYLAMKPERTCIRLTMIKGVNDVHQEEYARLINIAKPDFLEVKGYMFIGASRQRLSLENMPWHEEVVDFSQTLLPYLSDYDIVSEHIPSRVVMLARKQYLREDGWHTWIDFPKYDELVNSGKHFTAMDYLKKTPQTGLSGKKTKEVFEENQKKRLQLKVLPDTTVNEDTQELEFWKDDTRDDGAI